MVKRFSRCIAILLAFAALCAFLGAPAVLSPRVKNAEVVNASENSKSAVVKTDAGECLASVPAKTSTAEDKFIYSYVPQVSNTITTSADVYNSPSNGNASAAEEYNKPLPEFAQSIYENAVPTVLDTYNGIENTHALNEVCAFTDLFDINNLFDLDYDNNAGSFISGMRFDNIFLPGHELTPGDFAGLEQQEAQDLFYSSVDWDAMSAKAHELVSNALANLEISEANAQSYALTRLLCDYPNEMFWFDKVKGMQGGSTFEMSFTITETFITDIYYVLSFHVSDEFYSGYYIEYKDYGMTADIVSQAALSSMRSAETAAMNVVNAAAGLDDEDKLIYYHDWLCQNITYNNDAASQSGVYGQPWQMIYVFDGNPDTNVVCEGYSKAFKFLCEHSQFESDITCLVITGNLFQSGKLIGGHMWNAVVKDGVVYHADITNDDDDRYESTIHHDLFMVFPKTGEAKKHFYYSLESTCIHYVYDSEMFVNYIDPILYLPPIFAYGDVNMDGVIDICDCIKLSGGIKKDTLTFIEKKLADIDQSGTVDGQDISAIYNVFSND